MTRQLPFKDVSSTYPSIPPAQTLKRVGGLLDRLFTLAAFSGRPVWLLPHGHEAMLPSEFPDTLRKIVRYVPLWIS